MIKWSSLTKAQQESVIPLFNGPVEARPAERNLRTVSNGKLKLDEQCHRTNEEKLKENRQLKNRIDEITGQVF